MMSMGTRPAACEPVPDHEQKKRALGYLWEAWAEARLDGVDEDCLAQASLFTALAELVSTYGEDAAARYDHVFTSGGVGSVFAPSGLLSILPTGLAFDTAGNLYAAMSTHQLGERTAE